MPANKILRIEVPGQGLHEITAPVRELVQELASSVPRDVATGGLVTLFLRHTSASLLIQENADASARRDLERWIARLVPEGDALYTHTTEGPDDMPAHIRAALTATQLSIPLLDGALALGIWQGIYLFEHRRGRSQRQLVVHLG
ncbi:MAG: secondary thiamine-phosphate synthase enzyme YjbQ [Pseudomonadales bacterium]|jgi:secondary thiamine-phosphate synthase enzyme|nr:secondary thiamine-phosphate synthase enzyme YjbQ [Pseudomonadales bacterium]